MKIVNVNTKERVNVNSIENFWKLLDIVRDVNITTANILQDDIIDSFIMGDLEIFQCKNEFKIEVKGEYFLTFDIINNTCYFTNNNQECELTEEMVKKLRPLLLGFKDLIKSEYKKDMEENKALVEELKKQNKRNMKSFLKLNKKLKK